MNTYKSKYKGSQIDTILDNLSGVTIVQSSGTSTTDVMSQKAVMDAIQVESTARSTADDKKINISAIDDGNATLTTKIMSKSATEAAISSAVSDKVKWGQVINTSSATTTTSVTDFAPTDSKIYSASVVSSFLANKLDQGRLEIVTSTEVASTAKIMSKGSVSAAISTAINGVIVQTSGQNTNKVMSQKVVTDLFTNVSDRIQPIETSLASFVNKYTDDVTKLSTETGSTVKVYSTGKIGSIVDEINTEINKKFNTGNIVKTNETDNSDTKIYSTKRVNELFVPKSSIITTTSTGGNLTATNDKVYSASKVDDLIGKIKIADYETIAQHNEDVENLKSIIGEIPISWSKSTVVEMIDTLHTIDEVGLQDLATLATRHDGDINTINNSLNNKVDKTTFNTLNDTVGSVSGRVTTIESNYFNKSNILTTASSESNNNVYSASLTKALLNSKLTISAMASTTGASTGVPMTQKAVTTALDGKLSLDDFDEWYTNDYSTNMSTKHNYSAITVKSGETRSANTTIYSKSKTDELLANKTDKMVETTYSNLVSLRNNSNLVPGTSYRITNYQCIINITAGLTSAASNLFDIIVIADATNKLNENARAIHHSGDTYFSNNNLSAWELKYCLDNDTNRFEWASSSGKGVIYYMKDEFGNECSYDFKNIKFKRYKVSGTTGNPFVGEYMAHTTSIIGLSITSTSYSWAYTFSSSSTTNDTQTDYSLSKSNSVYGNKIGSWFSSGVLKLNNIVFYGANNYSNVFENDCRDNTFGSGCYSNMFDVGCYSNMFDGSNYQNKFGSNCYLNRLASSCNRNTFGEDCYSNVFSSTGKSYNHFGNCCNSNTISGYGNFLGNFCNSNTILNSYNSFGNYCESNRVLGQHNSFGNYCNNNTQSGTSSYNSFGNGCCGNIFNGNNDYNTISNGVSYIILPVSVKNAVIETGTSGTSSSKKTMNITADASYTQIVVKSNNAAWVRCVMNYAGSASLGLSSI